MTGPDSTHVERAAFYHEKARIAWKECLEYAAKRDAEVAHGFDAGVSKRAFSKGLRADYRAIGKMVDRHIERIGKLKPSERVAARAPKQQS